jgi:serine/threonine-protein kinase
VYAAVHGILGRKVALKVLHRHLVGVSQFPARFVQEARAVNLIRHPGIVDIHEIGTLDNGTPFYVMELVEGISLGTLLEQRGALAPLEALQILDPICDALQAAHAKGVIHRDVKASNVIVVGGSGPEWQVKLVDFGIAKVLHLVPGQDGITVAGQRLGTPHYMAPEQFRADPVDARTDVYALGVLLFRMLTKELPFHSRDLGEIERMHLETPPPPPSQRVPVSPAIDAVVLKAMDKDPDRRFESVAAFQAALRRAIDAPAARPAETRASRAIGIYVELRMPDQHASWDDRLLSDLGDIMDLAARQLDEAGFSLALQTATAILGTRTSSPDELGKRLSHGLRVAGHLFESLTTRPRADPRIRFNVCLHVDQVSVRVATNGAELLAGPLVQTGAWAPESDMPMLCVTEEVTRELPGIDSEKRDGRYILVRQRAGGLAS